MTRTLLDINVVLDLLTHRAGYSQAEEIMDLSRDGKLSVCTSAHAVTTLAYFLEKDPRTRGSVQTTLALLLSLVEVLPVNREILDEALRSPVQDYEDAVLETLAIRHGVDVIVTRNIRDFALSRVQAMTPSTFLGFLESGEGGFVREPAPSYHTRPRRRRAGTVKAKAA
jgi:predicted nucleic acid-binding protein